MIIPALGISDASMESLASLVVAPFGWGGRFSATEMEEINK